MTEEEARRWLIERFSVSRETMEQLEAFIGFLKREMVQQNLISASTQESIWSRHIVDSAQLLTLLPDGQNEAGGWIDLGSGAGFPGLIIAMLSNWHVTLVESRARRVDYLHRAIALLDLEDRIRIEGKALERVETASYSVISARAFAPLPRLLDLAVRFSTDKTIWLLPKGRNAAKELAEVDTVWHIGMDVIPSLTDGDAGILVGHVAGLRHPAQQRPVKRR